MKIFSLRIDLLAETESAVRLLQVVRLSSEEVEGKISSICFNFLRFVGVCI